MIKACIFDLDGTLAYTLDSMAAVGNQVVRKFGLNPMPVELPVLLWKRCRYAGKKTSDRCRRQRACTL